jgi:hypothetical protein
MEGWIVISRGTSLNVKPQTLCCPRRVLDLIFNDAEALNPEGGGFSPDALEAFSQ